jgi:hypothetical protein
MVAWRWTIRRCEGKEGRRRYKKPGAEASGGAMSGTKVEELAERHSGLRT